jgi:hypothetical protein
MPNRAVLSDPEDIETIMEIFVATAVADNRYTVSPCFEMSSDNSGA